MQPTPPPSPRDLRSADLDGADLKGADLQGADLSGASLLGALLAEADLRAADLRRADLRQANLQGADLRGARLGRADLQGASLLGARLEDADFLDALLDAASLEPTGIKQARNVPPWSAKPSPEQTLAAALLSPLLRGEEPQGEASLREVIAACPAWHRGHRALGDFLRAQRRHAESRAAYERALKCEPCDHYSAHALALSLDAVGESARAVAMLSQRARAFAREPSYGVALAWRLARLGDMAGARQHVERALREDPHSAVAWHLMGCVAQSQGRSDEARQAWEAALRCDPNHKEARQNLAAQARLESAQERWLDLLEPLWLDLKPTSHEVLSAHDASLWLSLGRQGGATLLNLARGEAHARRTRAAQAERQLEGWLRPTPLSPWDAGAPHSAWAYEAPAPLTWGTPEESLDVFERLSPLPRVEAGEAWLSWWGAGPQALLAGLEAVGLGEVARLWAPASAAWFERWGQGGPLDVPALPRHAWPDPDPALVLGGAAPAGFGLEEVSPAPHGLPVARWLVYWSLQELVPAPLTHAALAERALRGWAGAFGSSASPFAVAAQILPALHLERAVRRMREAATLPDSAPDALVAQAHAQRHLLERWASFGPLASLQREPHTP
jgi:Tfp pilus assembly protein PilF